MKTEQGPVARLIAILRWHANSERDQEILKGALREIKKDSETYAAWELRLAECLYDGLAYGNWPWAKGNGNPI